MVLSQSPAKNQVHTVLYL